MYGFGGGRGGSHGSHAGYGMMMNPMMMQQMMMQQMYAGRGAFRGGRFGWGRGGGGHYRGGGSGRVNGMGGSLSGGMVEDVGKEDGKMVEEGVEGQENVAAAEDGTSTTTAAGTAAGDGNAVSSIETGGKGGQTIPCRFGTACARPGCMFAHPAGGMGGVGGIKAPNCKYWPYCTNLQCPFTHPTTTTAAAGGSSAGFDISSVPCKYEPFCTRPGCPYMHSSSTTAKADKTKASAASLSFHKSVVFNGPGAKDHMSQRSFAVADSETESVLPGTGIVEAGNGALTADGGGGVSSMSEQIVVSSVPSSQPALQASNE
jgi:hypothetical protein